MENLTVIIALNHYGSFWKHFAEFKEKHTVLHQPRPVRIGKNCALCPKYWCSRPWAQSYSVNSIFITDSYKKHTNAHTRTDAQDKNTSVSRLVTRGKGKFRALDYPNRGALDKSCEMYNFDRCFSSCRRCKKEQFYSDQIIFETCFPKIFTCIMFNYQYALKSSFIAHTHKLGELSIICELYFF